MGARWVAAAAVILFAARSAGAGAAPADRAAKARALFADGDWERAAAEYEAALAGGEDAELLFGLGQAWQMAGEAGKAIRAYSRYLTAAPQGAKATDVARLVAELTPLTLKGAPPPKEDKLPPRIRHQPPGAWPAGEAVVIEASIEDPSGPYGPMLYWRPSGAGTFVPIPLEAKGGGAERFQGFIPPMDKGDVQYFLESYDTAGNGPTRNGTATYPHALRIGEAAAVAASAPVPAPAVEVPGAPEPPAGRGPWAWVLLGVGAAAAGSGAWFGLQTLEASGEWRSASSNGRRVEARDRFQGAVMRANVSWAAAGVLLAGGSALLLFTEF